MSKWISKPVIVTAHEITGVTPEIGGAAIALCGAPNKHLSEAQVAQHFPKVGDFLIELNPVDIYVCPRGVFQRKYEAVTPPSHPGLAPHQQRVVDEKAELDERLAKLTAFLGTEMFANLDDAEMERLQCQADVMREYSDILYDRIAAFVPA